MDKPLDFSMNSSKVKNKGNSEDESNETYKREDEANFVCKKEIETIDKNQNTNPNDILQLKKAKNEPDDNLLETQKPQITPSCNFRTGSKRTLNSIANFSDAITAKEVDIPLMPPLKQMSHMNNTNTENQRIGIPSDLLRDIIKLQNNQGVTQAKLSLEKQINALKAEHESLVKHNCRSLPEGSEGNLSPTRVSTQRSSEICLQPPTPSCSESVTNMEMDDEPQFKRAQDNTGNNKECTKDTTCNSVPLNERIFLQQKTFGNQSLPSIPPTIGSSISNHLTENRIEPSNPNTNQQQQQVPISSELHRVNQESLRNYASFRDNMLRHFAMTKMRRRQSASNLLDNEEDDDCNYVERRKKNNEAAKRSRDARRAKEDEVSIRAAFLEQENIQLKWDVTKLRAEVAKIRAYVIAEAAIDFQLQQQNQNSIAEEKSVN